MHGLVTGPDADGPTTVCALLPDLNGTLRCRYLPAERFDPHRTPDFADIVFGFDERDRLIPRPAGYPGWRPGWDGGFGDLRTAPDLASRRRLGWRRDQEAVFVAVRHRDGRPVTAAPRQIVRELTERLARAGVTVHAGFEVEFFLGGPGAAAEAAPATYGRDGTLPATGGNALGGVLDLLPAATALLVPTPAGYDRFGPDTAAGTTATWAPDNRTAGIRYLDDGDDARFEVRVAASDANPYLVLAAILAGTEHGVAAGIPPPEDNHGDVSSEQEAGTPPRDRGWPASP